MTTLRTTYRYLTDSATGAPRAARGPYTSALSYEHSTNGTSTSLPPGMTPTSNINRYRHCQPSASAYTSASNQSDLEGYHPSASASKQDGNQPTAPRSCPIDAALINNPYLPGRRKAPAQPKRTRLPHTDRRAQPAPKQRKPTPSSTHNQDLKPPPVADPSYSKSDSDEDDKDEPPPLIPDPDSDSDSEEPPPPPTASTTSNAPAQSGPQSQTEGGCPCCDYQSSDAEYTQPPPAQLLAPTVTSVMPPQPSITTFDPSATEG